MLANDLTYAHRKAKARIFVSFISTRMCRCRIVLNPTRERAVKSAGLGARLTIMSKGWCVFD